jgi:hypothetical protein
LATNMPTLWRETASLLDAMDPTRPTNDRLLLPRAHFPPAVAVEIIGHGGASSRALLQIFLLLFTVLLRPAHLLFDLLTFLR